MPYLKSSRRAQLKIPLNVYEAASDLNYLFTRISLDYLGQKGECYQTYNDIIGALECAKEEFYRRKIASYENKKIRENGEII